MVKITLTIDGMICGMCEAHINDAVRRSIPVKKVSSSHGKGRTEIIAEQPVDEQTVRSIIGETGYKVTDYACEPYEKKGFSLLKKQRRNG